MAQPKHEKKFSKEDLNTFLQNVKGEVQQQNFGTIVVFGFKSAAASGQTEIVKELLEKYSHLIDDKTKAQAFIDASSNGQAEVVKVLFAPQRISVQLGKIKKLPSEKVLTDTELGFAFKNAIDTGHVDHLVTLLKVTQDWVLELQRKNPDTYDKSEDFIALKDVFSNARKLALDKGTVSDKNELIKKFLESGLKSENEEYQDKLQGILDRTKGKPDTDESYKEAQAELNAIVFTKYHSDKLLVSLPLVFQLAAATGQTKIVKKLLKEHFASIDDETKKQAFIEASSHGHTEVVKILFSPKRICDQFRDVLAPPTELDIAFNDAISTDHADNLATLLKVTQDWLLEFQRKHPNDYPEFSEYRELKEAFSTVRNYAFMTAVNTGKHEIVKKFLESGFKLERDTDVIKATFDLAAEQYFQNQETLKGQNYKEIIINLLKYGADPKGIKDPYKGNIIVIRDVLFEEATKVGNLAVVKNIFKTFENTDRQAIVDLLADIGKVKTINPFKLRKMREVKFFLQKGLSTLGLKEKATEEGPRSVIVGKEKMVP